MHPLQSNSGGFIVAIDGPAGAGKSTVAAHLASRFGFLNLETGAMYRALALKAVAAGIAVDDGPAVLNLTGSTTIHLQPGEQGNRVLLDGGDVTGDIRTPEVTAAASRLSVHGPVREWMVAAQRALGRNSASGIVMEGRDIGTVVFPEADVKLFLDASLESRGDRRFAQGASESKSAVLQDMRDRDNRDRSREQSPLVPAADAILLDTTTLTLEEVIGSVESIVQETLGRRQSST